MSLFDELMNKAKARAAVENGTDQLSEIDNAELAEYGAPLGLPVANPTSIPLEAGLSNAELAQQMPVPAQAIQRSPAVLPQEKVNRTPASAPAFDGQESQNSSPRQESAEAKLERMMAELKAKRNTDLEDARSRQNKAAMLQGVVGNLGLLVGGAQAMNTKTSVTPPNVKGVDVPDLQAIVERQSKPEMDQLLAQYKLLQNQKAKANQSLTPYQMAMLGLNNRRLQQQEDNFSEGESRRLDEAKDKKITQLSDKTAKSGLENIAGTIDQIEQKLGMSIEDAIEKGVDVPGFGRAESFLPDFASGDDGRDLRQLVQGLQNVQISKQYGASQSTGEVNRFKKEFGAGTLEDDKTLLKGLANIKRKYNEDLTNIHAGYKPEVKQAYEEAGGVKPFSKKESKVDSKIDGYAKQHGLSYEAAEKILRGRGYNG